MAYIFIAFYPFGVKSNKNVAWPLTRGITTYMFVKILGTFTALWKVTLSFVMSFDPLGTAQLPLDGF